MITTLVWISVYWSSRPLPAITRNAVKTSAQWAVSSKRVRALNMVCINNCLNELIPGLKSCKSVARWPLWHQGRDKREDQGPVSGRDGLTEWPYPTLPFHLLLAQHNVVREDRLSWGSTDWLSKRVHCCPCDVKLGLPGLSFLALKDDVSPPSSTRFHLKD